MAIDSIDAKILEVLQENARVSISEISKRINLSLSAVSDRLKKLEQSGIIEQYTTVLSPKEMDRGLQAVMLVGVNGSLDTKDLFKIVNESDEILECFFVTGSCDYIIKIATKDTDSLAALMKKIKEVRGVSITETDVVLDQVKLKHSVSPV
ncbi:MAG: Lrp/AsnC family transcriptional regulator [Clostridia bacterium]|nr:Lrp/AsnC family transcriptional regulator [Clostridia bacterium]